MIIMNVGEDPATNATRTEDVGTTATAMCGAGVCIGLMSTESGFMPRQR
jgi:hypothetical protein